MKTKRINTFSKELQKVRKQIKKQYGDNNHDFSSFERVIYTMKESNIFEMRCQKCFVAAKVKHNGSEFVVILNGAERKCDKI